MRASWSLAVMLTITVSASEAPRPDDGAGLVETAPSVAGEPGNEGATLVADVAETTGRPDESELSAREHYNQGLHEARLGRWDGAESAFLNARDRAGPDADVLYRSAFNIAHVMASRATELETDTPERALEALRASASWFGEAVRAAPPGEEMSAKGNLELVQRRISRLADQLNGQQTLDQRLRRAIDDQRTIRDSVRGLLADMAVDQVEPTGFASAFGTIATDERVLLADISDVLTLAGEERAELEGLGEQRSQEQAVRAQQLLLLERYLSLAEQSLHDTRRRLRQQDAEVGHRLADNGLDELKRALEQLLDPVSVLKLIIAAEERLLAETAIVAADQPPAWLTAALLAANQERALVRTVDVKERFSYALENRASAKDGAEALAMAQIERAVPLLESGIDAMRDARSSLIVEGFEDAGRAEREAIAALVAALEQFADVKTLIELTYGSHLEVHGALDVPDQSQSKTTTNQSRLARLNEMLQAELSEAESSSNEVEGAAERTQQALELTAGTRASLTALLDAWAAGGDAAFPSGQALERLEALRRLYFTIVEHLKELGSEQAETWDQTATVQASSITDGAVESASLGRVAAQQTVHRDRADQLQNALVQMAEQAASQQNAHTGEDEENPFALAAEDVRLASAAMTSAADILGRDAAKLAPADLEPASTNQRDAVEHIAQAIARLQPPQHNDSSGDGESGDDANAQDEDDAQMTKRQALQRLQAIRDREAERRRQRDVARQEPVEKDW